MKFKEKLYDEFVHEFANILSGTIKEKEPSDLIFLCVGTDRVIGDSFGPLVGYRLKELYKEERRVHVFGDLEVPVSISNIEKIIERINQRYEKPFIIVIDSAVSTRVNIGKIVVGRKRMNLGSSLDKKVIKVGDISIKGIVSEDSGSPRQNFMLLQKAPLNLVISMAETTAKGIYDVINV